WLLYSISCRAPLYMARPVGVEQPATHSAGPNPGRALARRYIVLVRPAQRRPSPRPEKSAAPPRPDAPRAAELLEIRFLPGDNGSREMTGGRTPLRRNLPSPASWRTPCGSGSASLRVSSA